MSKNFSILRAIQATAGAAAIGLFASTAHGACGPFPTSNFIGTFTHEQVSDYVAEAHGGDWQPYIDMLEANFKRLQDIAATGRSATLRVRGEPVELQPRELSRFVYVSRQFNAVVQCLAANEASQLQMADNLDLNAFETASGTGNATAPDGSESLALSSGVRIVDLNDEETTPGRQRSDLRITPICRDGDTIFQVENIGGPWPDTGMFTMYRLDGDRRQMIGARRLTMGTGDTRDFEISAVQNRTGHVGISINPSWYDRADKIDASARCG